MERIGIDHFLLEPRQLRLRCDVGFNGFRAVQRFLAVIDGRPKLRLAQAVAVEPHPFSDYGLIVCRRILGLVKQCSRLAAGLRRPEIELAGVKKPAHITVDPEGRPSHRSSRKRK